MKKLLFILSFLIAFSSYSQNNDGIELCLQYQKSLKSFITDKEAEDALNKILNVIGASRNFLLVSCDEINNALAITFKGERYILYDKDFIDKIEDMTNDWSGLFILAHEIGHHINGHTRDFLLAKILDEQSKQKQREEELEADEFAGFVAAKLGAKYSDIENLIDLISSAGDDDDSYSTHPNKKKRLFAIGTGFANAKKNNKENITKGNNIDAEYKVKNIIEENNLGTGYLWQYETWENPDFDGGKTWIDKETLSLDPLELLELKKENPILTKIAKSKGYSKRSDGKIIPLTIHIEQSLYHFKEGGALAGTEYYNLNEQKLMPYKKLEISLRGFQEMPEFWHGSFRGENNLSDMYKNLEQGFFPYSEDLTHMNLPMDSQHLLSGKGVGHIIAPLQIFIDTEYIGEMPVYLGGWGGKIRTINEEMGIGGPYIPAESWEGFGPDPVTGPFPFLGASNYFLEKKGSKGSRSGWLIRPDDILLWLSFGNMYDDDYTAFYKNDTDYLKFQLKLLDKIKKGKTMYLKVDDKYWHNDRWNYFEEFESYTYEFDLTGSSKALEFNY